MSVEPQNVVNEEKKIAFNRKWYFRKNRKAMKRKYARSG